eukprot:CAMPEP_0173360908 /NCGR_PEP_ID=MMETSP1144-20121109/20878_1 /TAXON_ID=483371 /ORGANISM="non described non described, Strain CCMP2298" /LENGTH=136 /DNA_ID=CAMNT_0014310373 /DNA_START=54 /DNA_END=461 /DNA_ORIENTATION=-
MGDLGVTKMVHLKRLEFELLKLTELTSDRGNSAAPILDPEASPQHSTRKRSATAAAATATPRATAIVAPSESAGSRQSKRVKRTPEASSCSSSRDDQTPPGDDASASTADQVAEKGDDGKGGSAKRGKKSAQKGKK